jgi:hypothetical protein
MGQCFTGKNGYSITAVQFRMQKVLAPTANLVACIYNITGSYGTTGAPTGAALATSNAVASSSLPASYDWVTFTFSTPLAITNQSYCVTIQVSGSGNDWQNYANASYDSSAPTHDGNMVDYNNSAWSTYNWADLNFSVSGVTAQTVTFVQHWMW